MAEKLKQHDIVKKLLMTAGYLGLLCIFYYFKIQCFFLTLFHIPCPGCGMSRALLAALRLDFRSAFDYHLMFWSVPLLYLYFLLDGRVFGSKFINRAVFIFILSGFVINWIFSLINHLFC